MNNFLFFAQVKQQLVVSQLSVQKADSQGVGICCVHPLFVSSIQPIWLRNGTEFAETSPPKKGDFIQNTDRTLRTGFQNVYVEPGLVCLPFPSSPPSGTAACQVVELGTWEVRMLGLGEKLFRR